MSSMPTSWHRFVILHDVTKNHIHPRTGFTLFKSTTTLIDVKHEQMSEIAMDGKSQDGDRDSDKTVAEAAYTDTITGTVIAAATDSGTSTDTTKHKTKTSVNAIALPRAEFCIPVSISVSSMSLRHSSPQMADIDPIDSRGFKFNSDGRKRSREYHVCIHVFSSCLICALLIIVGFIDRRVGAAFLWLPRKLSIISSVAVLLEFLLHRHSR